MVADNSVFDCRRCMVAAVKTIAHMDGNWKIPGTGLKHHLEKVARVTGLEPATSGVTGRRSNQLSYTR
jgi:hypothetical protein